MENTAECFDNLSLQILEYIWSKNPVMATLLGIHKYDDKLECLSEKDLQERLDTQNNFLSQLQKIKIDSLNTDQKIDLDLLKSLISVNIFEQEELNIYTRNASLYPQLALYGVYLLLQRNFAPKEERLALVLNRISKIPEFLKNGIDNLKLAQNIPHIWTEIAIENTLGGINFFKNLVLNLNTIPNKIKSQMEKNALTAISSFENYLRFLKKTLLSKSNGNFVIGKEKFDQLLKTKHMLYLSTSDIVSIGEDEIVKTKKEIADLAHKIDQSKTPNEIIKNLKKSIPDPKKLLDIYNTSMNNAKDFIITKNLVTVPKDEILYVQETPRFERHLIPYAAYLPSGPHEKKQEGFFWVTPVDDGLSKMVQMQQLEGHCSYSIIITAVHEGYPGHHLQRVHASKIKSFVRKQMESTLFEEGWALYCEEMMIEQGYSTDPRVKLTQLKDHLWRACRVVIDIKLQTGQMTINDACNMLTEVAMLEPHNSLSEIKRYTISPTQPLSYLIGKLEIKKLKKDFMKKNNNTYSLKNFHDSLLSFGTIPLKLVRDGLAL
jgi:uncharacterized protein (DUF885 family)